MPKKSTPTRKRPGQPAIPFHQEYCEKLIKHMQGGLSFPTFCAEVNCSVDTIYRWVKRYPQFCEAKKQGESLCLAWWEKIGRQGVVGKLPGFNTACWIFNMKNRFHWRDKHEIMGETTVRHIIDIEGEEDG